MRRALQELRCGIEDEVAALKNSLADWEARLEGQVAMGSADRLERPDLLRSGRRAAYFERIPTEVLGHFRHGALCLGGDGARWKYIENGRHSSGDGSPTFLATICLPRFTLGQPVG